MSIKELIWQELERVPEGVQLQVLDFLRWLKTQRTVPSCVVPLAATDLQAMVLVEPVSSHSTLPAPHSLAEVRRELRAALDAQGYASRDSVVALVQDVKRELAAEQDARSPEKA